MSEWNVHSARCTLAEKERERETDRQRGRQRECSNCYRQKCQAGPHSHPKCCRFPGRDMRWSDRYRPLRAGRWGKCLMTSRSPRLGPGCGRVARAVPVSYDTLPSACLPCLAGPAGSYCRWIYQLDWRCLMCKLYLLVLPCLHPPICTDRNVELDFFSLVAWRWARC